MALKRVLSLLIALSMVLSVSVTSFANNETAEAAVKYNIKAYEKAQTLVKSILNESVFGDVPEKLLTRAEFVKGATKLLAVSEISGATIYADVSADSEYAGAINAAYNKGWISKAENFNPDAQITYAQALKIILVAANYAELAETKGGFPTGYLTVAARIDLLDDLNVSYADSVSAADATILLYNFMLSPTFQLVALGEGFDYKTKEETYLETIYDVYPVEGIVTATEHNSIVMDAPFKKDSGKIAIDGVEYMYDGSDIAFLGMNVIAYCEKNNSNLNKILFLVPDGNEEMTIYKESFDRIYNDSIEYYVDEKLRTADLDPAYKVIYNGRRVAALEDYMLNDIGASIRLLSNNSDDEYEYVFVNSYKYGVITSIDYVEGYIAFKTPSELLDFTDDKDHVAYIRDENGNRKEIYELAKDAAVAIKASADGKVYELIIMSDTASGLITAVHSGTGEIEIDNKTYKMSKDFEKGYIESGLISAGDRINAAVGVHGELACLIKSFAEMNYGILLGIDRATAGLERKPHIKVLAEDCTFKTLAIAEKIVADGGNKKLDYDKAYDYISGKIAEAKADTDQTALVIKYSVNEDGLINIIDFASDDANNFDKVLDTQNSLTRYFKKEINTRYRDGGFPSKVMLRTSKIVGVPEDVSERDEESNYSQIAYSTLSSNLYYTFDAYDVDESGNAAFVVIYTGDSSKKAMVAYNASYMIEKVTKAISGDEEGVKLQCWSNNQFETLFMPNTVEVKKTSGEKTLVPGDIVRFTVSDGVVKEVYVDYDYSSGKPVSDNEGGARFDLNDAQNNLAFVVGKVYNAGTNSIVINGKLDENQNADLTDFSFDNLRPYSINENIACYYKETGTIRTIRLSDIRTYKGYGQNADTIYLRSDFGIPKSAFIIR